jgi:hypothetical protein
MRVKYPSKLYKSPTYISWQNMVQRCKSVRPKEVDIYLNRGITVCDKWKNFAGFYEDMGLRPKGKTIDRVNNDLGYFKENCRWATKSQQVRNIRSRSNTGHLNIQERKERRNPFIVKIDGICHKSFKSLSEAITYRDALKIEIKY